MFHMFPPYLLCHLWNRPNFPWLCVLLGSSQRKHHPVSNRIYLICFVWNDCLKKNDVLHHVSSSIFLLLHKEWLLYNFKLCILCLHLPTGKHVKSMNNITVCKSHYRRDLMISAIRCGGKNYIYILISISIIGQMSCKIPVYLISTKNPISCITIKVRELKFSCCFFLPFVKQQRAQRCVKWMLENHGFVFNFYWTIWGRTNRYTLNNTNKVQSDYTKYKIIISSSQQIAAAKIIIQKKRKEK